MAIKQISLLLWKNWVLHKRRPWSTTLEAVLPILFMLILVLIRQSDLNDDVRQCVNATQPGCSTPAFLATSGVGNCSAGFDVVYTPPQARDIMNKAKSTSIPYRSLAAADSEQEMVNTLMSLPAARGERLGQCVVGVAFTNYQGPDFAYSLRFSSSPGGEDPDSRSLDNWRTGAAFPFFSKPGPRSNNMYGSDPGYVNNGFVAMQHSINRAIADTLSPGAAADFDKIQLQRFPIPPYTDDPFVNAIRFGMPLLLMLSFLFTAINIVRSIVLEKERRLKESMKMMGLKNWVHWTAWFIDFFIFLTISVAIITVLIKGGKVLQNSDPVVIFVYLMLYAISSIMFCFLVSVFFSKASTGAAAGGILWFCNYIPYSFIGPQYDTLGPGIKQGVCILSTSCMSIGANIISTLEAQGAGMTWDTLADPPSVDDNFALSSVFGMLVFDIFLYGLLTWYIEAVFPGQYGVPRPWYFPFQSTYWCGARQASDDIPMSAASESHLHPDVDPLSFEPEPNGAHAGISVRGLYKAFDTKVAVNRMWLNMYEGQVTALLGHNGAGKTTTMSILTGLFPPTEGTAIISGKDIRSDITEIQQSLGICPQHDVLFDTLTVAEHLWFFCRLKGVPADRVPAFVDEMIQDLELPEKRNAQSMTLSGGQKRRLSTGIALVGGSKVVILDEPTSGMDPSARRATWDLITKHKAGRTILLSTHFMDEADLLGDRIAIMADGVVRCLGTSLFLKGRYGVGYHLTLVKTRNAETQEDLCDVAAITALIREAVPAAEMTGNVGAELTFVLPRESSPRFAALFTRLEQTRAALGIDSYGVSVTTMEEVFLRVGEYDASKRQIRTPEEMLASGDDGPSPAPAKGSISRRVDAMDFDDTDSDEEVGLLTGAPRGRRHLLWQQFYAMIVKRLLHSIRNKTAILTQLLLPLFFTMIALIVVKIIPGPSNSAPRQLDNLRENYKANTFVYLSNTTAGPAIRDYVSAFGPEQSVVQVPSTFSSTFDYLLYFAGTTPKDVAFFNKHTEVALTLTDSALVAWFNDYAYHSAAEALSAMSNALLRARQPAASIVTVNHPLPLTLLEKARADAQTMMGFNLSFSILFGMSFLASSFVLFIVAERANKAKHIQFVSGVNALSYWCSSFLWDYLNYLVPVVSIMILFAAFSVSEYMGARLGYVLILFLLYGWALIPLMYLASFLFVNTSVAYSRLTMFNVVTGLAALLTVAIFSIINPATSDTLKSAFLALPNFAFGQGISDIYTNADNLQTSESICNGFARGMPYDVQECCDIVALAYPKLNLACQKDYLAWASPGIGRSLLVMGLEGAGFFLLVLLIEYRVFSGLLAGIVALFRSQAAYESDYEEEDEDVRAERERVSARRGTNDNVLVVDGLKKTYNTGTLGCGPIKEAVRGISVGVPHGECFGLLGVNGAGKTTTFGMLTGDLAVSGGGAFVEGNSILTNMKQVRRRLGYCPQFDGLIDLMTGRELLTMYARLRGVPEHRLASVVSELIASLSLEKHADKYSGTYSGGNKRKLSTAIALIGDPAIVFLDEPTTGMDPGARRFLWNRINAYTRAGRSIVLTSHSMEECEALCTRIAIMVNGKFTCIGSPQHLKTRFGRGYSLMVRVAGSTGVDTRPVKDFLRENLPDLVIKEEHQGYIKCVVGASIGWAGLFALLESAKQRLNLEDYSVSQTTLEQIFLDFARHQAEEAQHSL